MSTQNNNITLTGGIRYFIFTEKASGASVDPYIRLYGDNNTQITYNDNYGVGHNSLIIFKPQTSTTFTIRWGAYNESTGTYNGYVAYG